MVQSSSSTVGIMLADLVCYLAGESTSSAMTQSHLRAFKRSSRQQWQDKEVEIINIADTNDKEAQHLDARISQKGRCLTIRWSGPCQLGAMI